MFREITLLVLEGDAAGLAGKVSELSSERPQLAGAERSATEHASPAPPAGFAMEQSVGVDVTLAT